MEIDIGPYDGRWPAEFQERAKLIRQALGELAQRIDHIVSTSVPGLPAKPVIDIQVTVASFEPLERLVRPMEQAGFSFRANNPDRTKRYFREGPGGKRTHIHVRERGSWPEQSALLFRDYLRGHPEECRLYAEWKYRLAGQFRHDRQRYTEGKEPVVWEMLRRAHSWTQRMGWRPGPSDG